MRFSRHLAAIALATIVTAGSLLPARAASLPSFDREPDFISWFVTHKTHTIDVSVRLMFMPRHSGDQVGPKDVQRIVDGIQSFWQGKMYRCYKLVFHISATIGTTVQDAGPSRLVIRLDDSPPSDFRSDVWGDQESGAGQGSVDPADRVVPLNDIGHLSTWAIDEESRVYAHEFGHALGLNDGYVEGTQGPNGPQPKPGAPKDLMWSEQPGTAVSQDMIDRAVKRSGQVDDSTLECDLKVDYHDRSGLVYKGTKCTEPAGLWVLDISGRVGKITWRGEIDFDLDPLSLRGQLTHMQTGTGPFNTTIALSFSGTAHFKGGIRRRSCSRVEAPGAAA